jgi:hypothetical protein
MRDYANSGHLVNVKELVGFVPSDITEQFNQAEHDGDWETMESLLNDHLISTFPRPSGAFVVRDEDETEDMLSGEMFARFDEDDLFVKTKTPEMLMMESVGVIPKFNQWTTFG